MRAEVFHTLEGPKDGTRHVGLSNESLLINELVREYLTYSGYHNALGVFMAESGQPEDKALDRAFIRDEVTMEIEGVPVFQRVRGFAIICVVDVALVTSLSSLEPFQCSSSIYERVDIALASALIPWIFISHLF